ncbi:MAG: hypothetical protein EOP06_10335 [Proteobacteria bacterium]|nr:MAG: hypothetical protein EOP06_10335 [Pseudomonadota bacterium]
MKNSFVLALVLLLVQSVPQAGFAATEKTPKAKSKVTGTGSSQKKSKKTTTAPDAKLGTSFKFDGSALRGKYQSSLSTTATVENDKYMDDLLAGRKEFNDRLQRDQERN